MYVIVKGRGKRALNDFESGGIPTNGKRYDVKFSDKMFHFYNDCCSSFDSTADAEEHIEFIKKEILENKERYERHLKGSTEKLMKIAERLKVVDINESNFANCVTMKWFGKW